MAHLQKDSDFGATPVVVHPLKTCKRKLVAVEHKAGVVFILDAANLTNTIQEVQVK